MRKEFELTADELEALYAAAKPVRVMKIGTYDPPSPQDHVDYAWRKIGQARGFDYTTVKPVKGKSDNFFTAEEIPID